MSTTTTTLDVTTIAGVLNDGSVDVGSLITAQVTNDMILYFPEGTYLFTTSLYIENKSNVTIKGSLVSEFQKDGDNTNPVIHFNGCRNCSINFILFSTYVNKSANNGTPIVLINSVVGNTTCISVNNCSFIDSSINANTGAMILIDGNSNTYTSSYNTIQYCFINGNSRCGVGISQSRTKHNTIQNNIITNTGLESITIDNASDYCYVYKNSLSYAYGGTGTIGLDNSHHCSIENNDILNMTGKNGIGVANNYTESFMTDEGESYDTFSNIIAYNTIQKCNNGIYIVKNNTTAYDFTIRNNVFNNNTTGVYLNDINYDKFTLADNTFSNNVYNLIVQ